MNCDFLDTITLEFNEIDLNPHNIYLIEKKKQLPVVVTIAIDVKKDQEMHIYKEKIDFISNFLKSFWLLFYRC